MINWIKLWVEQIIIAVIISIIVEMILPEGNKKYIKMVLGLYILFVMIGPVISKATNSDEILDFDYKNFFSKDVYSTSNTEKFEDTNNKLIEQTYIEKIKSDIETKIEKMGYSVDNINISIIGNKSSENYGQISNLEIKISKLKEDKSSTNKIQIQNINVGNKVTSNINSEELNITETDKKKIIEYITNEYSIMDKKIIKID